MPTVVPLEMTPSLATVGALRHEVQLHHLVANARDQDLQSLAAMVMMMVVEVLLQMTFTLESCLSYVFRPSHGGHDSNPGNNLHVSGVSNKVTDRDLSEAFSKYGVVTKAQVMYDPHTREPRGFAFVTFEKAEDAEAAMAALSGTDFFGRRISIEKLGNI
ncbi:RNA-binding domain-containing protein [Violaceomyces palustris]|uniref:RNA-binding domain-containing protein n=1 Tax=Violaceomyces palustris TaxID=1673888 RepID=A0ACD0P3S3_9BASI|nr:RNA-binding domain-containing protein [Violaceomyces palustris]